MVYYKKKYDEKHKPTHILRSIIQALVCYSLGFLHGQSGSLSSSSFFAGVDNGIRTKEATAISSDIHTNKIKETASSNDGMILPFERTEPTEYLPGHFTDTYTYFHHYLHLFAKTSPESPKDFTTFPMKQFPMLHIWPVYFEAYHNHWQRFRGKEVVFMEIGVQSGGKIPLLREYFGPGLTYIGVDVNPSCKMFESADWIHIEIGDSGKPAFLATLKKKYPKVDIFLDDGGHMMNQQRAALREMLPHVQPEGVYMCEDLSTSWSKKYGVENFQDSRNPNFVKTTMVGLVHLTLDWLNAGWIPGTVMNYALDHPKLQTDFWPDDPWWKEFSKTVKHIHNYNQIVVYEKGLVETPFADVTVGFNIPYRNSGVHEKVDWTNVLDRIREHTRAHAVKSNNS